VVTIDQFKATLSASSPPRDLGAALVALWFDAKGNWEEAHRVAQDIEDETGAWVHAYLHRKEGDASNAAYWYRRASKPVARVSLDEEWEVIATALLGPLTTWP
jgi:hypothetical protein